MTISISPTDSEVFAALVAFLAAAIPAGVPIVRGQVNRVPTPSQADYVAITGLMRPRLATNIDSWADAKFEGSISGQEMTITKVYSGVLVVGSPLFGVGFPSGLNVSSLGTGAGGVGTYGVSAALTFGPGVISAGTKIATEKTEVHIQIDVHGPGSADNAQRISALFRDEFATSLMAQQNAAVSPLHADEPRNVTFINENNQYEPRWIIDACLQVNDVVSGIPQQFADEAVATIVNVDATYPL